MKKAIKILEKRIKELYDESSKESENFGLLLEIGSKIDEAKLILARLEAEYDKARSKQRASRHPKLSSGETQGSST